MAHATRPFPVSAIATHRPALARVASPSSTSRVVQRLALAVVVPQSRASSTFDTGAV
mgnify:CR=1 FL=1